MAFEPPRRLVRALGETAPDGDDWLAKLPEVVERAVARRELAVERVQVPGGRSSLVVLVRTAEGASAVLKLAPRRARPESERAALAHWGGRGAVQLRDVEGGGGTAAGGSRGSRGSTRVCCCWSGCIRTCRCGRCRRPRRCWRPRGTLRRLWVEPPASHPFETVAERTGRQAEAMRAGAAADAEIAPLVDAALAVRAELLAEPPERRLLHGTFRQSKVLAGDRMPWLAVGPDPVVGESAFDLARLVRDRVEDLIAQPSGASTTRRRIKRLAESLEVDQERLRGWTLFRAVESGVRARRVGREQDAELLLEFAGWL
ncbi:aminoglycoside phosphotransferase family protein [Streptomyces sp. RS2]|uniref:aminoglycoside phosphotransferase family protein n=1 Tax=Streptomyces sp. RS2 TaxID=1451205 RepID=UPI0027E27804|nr:aminoglycoside phosphotransferase family protein [Streptomyces sp. RS2]